MLFIFCHHILCLLPLSITVTALGKCLHLFTKWRSSVQTRYPPPPHVTTTKWSTLCPHTVQKFQSKQPWALHHIVFVLRWKRKMTSLIIFSISSTKTVKHRFECSSWGEHFTAVGVSRLVVRQKKRVYFKQHGPAAAVSVFCGKYRWHFLPTTPKVVFYLFIFF